jgi:hypothetical protein
MTTREERHAKFHDILVNAAVDAMKALDDDLSAVTEEGAMNILVSLAGGMLDAHRVAVNIFVKSTDGPDDPVLRTTKKAFMIQMAKRREQADGANVEEYASRLAVIALLSALPDDAPEAQISSVHLYAIRQFVFAQMAQSKDARTIRAIVDEAITNAIIFNGKGGKT